MRVGSLFAGVEGFGQGMEAAGFEVTWQVEIDKDAVSVLERHYPDTLRVRDVREAGAHNLTPVDVITFGSPCQGFSVAGRQEGLEDVRSGLFGEAIRIIRELRPAIAIWENVPGAFSTNDGRDFGAVLSALADAGALDISWRVLDAQWFGVPQRRRRIFLIADFGAERAAQVLFEPEGGRRDSEACRAPWEGTAGGVEGGFDESGLPNISPCLVANTDGTGASRNVGGTAYIPTTGAIAGGVTARYGKGADSDVTDTLLIADTVRSHPRPGSNSVGNLTIAACDVADTLSVGANQTTGFVGDDVAHAVGSAVSASYGNGSPRGDGSDNLVVAATFDPRQVTSQANRTRVALGSPANTLHGDGLSVLHGADWQQAGGTVEDGTPCLSTTRTPAVGGRPGMAVRRLTPRECERLMGWPDDWTRWRADGSEISDGPRYRMIGNGVVAPVAAWIARRLRRAMEATA